MLNAKYLHLRVIIFRQLPYIIFKKLYLKVCIGIGECVGIEYLKVCIGIGECVSSNI